MDAKRLMAALIVGMMIGSGLGIVSVGLDLDVSDDSSMPIEPKPMATGVQRTVLMEDYTEWGCGPCASHNPAWTAAIESRLVKVAPSYVHVWWPTAATDPIYQNCDLDNSVHNRVAFYGFNGVPSAYIDGKNVATHQGQAAYEAMIDANAAIPARLSIDTSGYINSGTNTATINARIQAALPLEAADYRVMIYLWENNITRALNGDAPPYPNGETQLDWAVWDIVPNGAGTAIWPSGAVPGDYADVSYTVPLNSDWVKSALGITIFVQNFGTHVVENAAVERFQKPMVSLISPSSIETELELNGIVPIGWTAIDTQDAQNTLDISIYYSLNGGTSWTSIMSGTDNNNPPYNWNTIASGAPDSPSYLLRVVATDSGGSTGSGLLSRSMEYLTIDNTPDDRWYLQSESSNLAPNLDLDMKPSERYGWDEWNLVEKAGETVTEVNAAGEYSVQTFASEYTTDDVYDIAGPWDFSIYAKAGNSNPTVNGYLYAKIYAHDGAASRLLATTGYDNELVGSFFTYHQFVWTYTAPSVFVWTGERIIVEIMFHATSGTSAALYNNYARSETLIDGVATTTYTNTFASDNVDESIQEEVNYITRYIDENFGSGIFPPTGWSIASTGTTGTWSVEGSNYAGGNAAPELRFLYGASGTGTSRFYRGPIDTTGQTSLTMTWDTYYDAYQNGVTVKVQTSTNGATWVDSGWQIAGGASDVGPAPQSVTLTTGVGSATYYVAFVVDGDSYQLDAWYNDDVLLIPTGNGQTSLMEHKWVVKVPTGSSPYQFNLEASRVAGTDNDNFQFAYSTDGSSYTDMVQVNSATDVVYTYALPVGLPEDVYIRVVDTIRTAGSTSLSNVDVDQMYITSTDASQMTIGFDHYSTASYVEPFLTLIPDDKPVINILSPASEIADQILTGSSYAITWTATDTEDAANTLDIKIEYSDNAGTSWTVLEDGTDNNDGTYPWNIGALLDGVNYMVRISAKDSIPHSGVDTTLAVSIDNVPNDRWYLQVQTTALNNRLNMMPVDIGPNSISSTPITISGYYQIGTWQTDVLTATNIDGTWDFNLYGQVNNDVGTGYLSARIYSSTGPILLDTTVNDNENAFAYTSQHLFTWTDTLAGSFSSGDSLLVEIWVEVTNMPLVGEGSPIYNFAGTHTHNAYYIDGNEAPTVTYTSATSQTANAALDASDDNRYTSGDPGIGDYASLRCFFNISELVSAITQIEFKWEGYVSRVMIGNEINLYVRDQTAGTWTLLGGSDVGLAAGGDVTLQYTLSGVNFADYVTGASNTLIFHIQFMVPDSAGQTTTFTTDYLSVTPTWSVPIPSFTAYFDYVGSQSFIEPTITGGSTPDPYEIPLNGKTGWVFVSFPSGLTGSIQTILTDAVAAGGDGLTTWTVAKWYDPQDDADHWKMYRNGGTANDMPTVTNSMGFWIWLTANGGDQMLTLNSYAAIPATTVINIYDGWNLVGCPSATNQLGSSLPGTVDILSVYSASAAYTEYVGAAMDPIALSQGNAYFMHSVGDTTWTVNSP